MKTTQLNTGKPDEVIPYRDGAGDWRDVNTYDQVRYLGPVGSYKQATMRAVYKTLLGSVQDKQILDVACGTGRGALDFSSEARLVIAYDASTDMLSAARKKVAGIQEIQFVCGLAQSIPFSDNHFEMVTCLNFLHLFETSTQRLIVKELIRVVRPGGVVLLEFDNALQALGLGLLKRWFGRDPGTLPSELKSVIPSEARMIGLRGALIPFFWRWLYRFPRLARILDRVASSTLICRIVCLRVYVTVQKSREFHGA